MTHYLDQVPCGGSGDNNIDENDEDDDDDNDSDDVDDDVDQETVTDFHRERMEEHPLPRVSFSCICLFSKHFGMYLFLLKLKKWLYIQICFFVLKEYFGRCALRAQLFQRRN